MVGRRDVGHRGQGDVRHGNISSDMHKLAYAGRYAPIGRVCGAVNKEFTRTRATERLPTSPHNHDV